MAIRIPCPACDTVNSFSEEKRGKRVKCKSCAKPISVPDDDEHAIQDSPRLKVKTGANGRKNRDDDDRDRPTKKDVKKPKKGAPVLLILGGVTLVALLLCVVGVGGAGAYLYFWAKEGVQGLTKEVADAAAKQKAEFEKAQKLVDLAKKNDPLDPFPPFDPFPKVDPRPKLDPTPKVDPTPKPKVNPKPKTDPAPKVDPTPQPKVDPIPTPKVDPIPTPVDPIPTPKVDPTPQPKVDPNPKTEPKPKIDPRPKIAPLPPLDPQLVRNPANLMVNLVNYKTRSIMLNTAWSETFDKRTTTETIDAQVLETLTARPQGATLWTNYGTARWVVDFDGQAGPRDPQAVTGFRQIPPMFVIDQFNGIKERTDRPAPPLSKLVKGQVTEAYWQLHTAMEVASVPLPNRNLNSLQNWQATVPISLRKKKVNENVDLVLNCVYEGMRPDQQKATITVTGKVASKNFGPGAITGDVAGRITFDLLAGMISAANLKIYYEYASVGPVNDVLDIQLTRVPGNPFNIQSLINPTDPLAKNDPKIDPKINPKVDPKVDPKGKIVFQPTAVLTQFDPPDPAQKISPKAKNPTIHRMKPFQLQLQGGKKYTIALTTQAFNSQMRLQNVSGQTLAQDSGLGGGQNSKIDFTPQQTGPYYLFCIARDGKLGQFQLTVTEY